MCLLTSIDSTAPDDYTAITNQVLTFDGSRNSITVNVPIVNDTDFEPDENFIARLSLQVPSQQVLIDPDNANIVIEDNDSKTPLSYW